jgi:hypothetical protein
MVCPDFCFEVFRFDEPVLTDIARAAEEPS